MTLAPPHQEKRNSRWLPLVIRLLAAACLVALVISGTALMQQQRDYRKGNDSYDQIRQLASQKPPVQGPQGEVHQSPINFSSLWELNPDVVGWLQGPDTVIDYPVVQGQDNAHYLNHLLTGERNRLGTLFHDYRSRLDMRERVLAIYGHNMKDGSMLTSISRYKDPAYFEAHPALAYYTPEANYTIEVFAGITVSGTSGALRLSFDGNQDFLDYLDELRSMSSFQSPVTVEASDSVIALVTCTYNFSNARYILFGKLVKTS